MSPPGPAMKPSSDIVTEKSTLPMICLRPIGALAGSDARAHPDSSAAAGKQDRGSDAPG
jgi:hypothetical protein